MSEVRAVGSLWYRDQERLPRISARDHWKLEGCAYFIPRVLRTEEEMDVNIPRHLQVIGELHPHDHR